jgi:hypothetical protein
MASKPKAKPKAKAKAGAKAQKPIIIPSGAWGAKYSEELGNHLCDLLSDGKTLNAICKGDPSLPAPRTIRRWAADPEHPFSPQYARAREIGYHAMADEYIDIGDTVSEDPGAVAKARLRAESRKWMLSKALPKLYGDRMATEVSGPNGGPLEVTSVDRLELARWIALVMTNATEQLKRSEARDV